MDMRPGAIAATVLLPLMMMSACTDPAPAPALAPRVAPPASDAAKVASFPGLHNVVAFAPGYLSGSVPEGKEGFETLRAMGVKTILSVDGAEPDVALARENGLRYVHLPIGYDGMDRARTLEIARSLKELPGPVYLHCHHGKHRSAGALGAATVALGLVTPAQATARMRVSGTAPDYEGLYRCVATASVATAAELAGASHTFPEVSRPSGLVKTMLEIDEVGDHLKEIEKAGWKAPRGHPDLVPAAEAGRLADLFRHLKDDAQAKRKGDALLAQLAETAALAQAIEDGLVAKPPVASAELGARFAAVVKSCKTCHAKHRD